MSTELSVNVNKIATLRNARGGDRPDVLRAARTCIEAGCYGITVHPRPDERHIRRTDVVALAKMLRETPQYAGTEFNIEGYPSKEYMALVLEIVPEQCTLVPDPPGVLTSNAGWDLQRPGDLEKQIARLNDAGSRVSLFMEADPTQMRLAAELGADRIELYTGPYAEAFETPQRDEVYKPYRDTALAAADLGLGLNAGHDLSLMNLPFFAQNTPQLLEVSIGHALVCDALYMGMEQAVKAYLAALQTTT